MGAEVLIAVGLGVGRFVFGPFVGLNDGLLLGLEEKQNMRHIREQTRSSLNSLHLPRRRRIGETHLHTRLVVNPLELTTFL